MSSFWCCETVVAGIFVGCTVGWIAVGWDDVRGFEVGSTQEWKKWVGVGNSKGAFGRSKSWDRNVEICVGLWFVVVNGD